VGSSDEDGGGRPVDFVDPRTTNSDCWIEFRATLRRPSGYLRWMRRRRRGGSSLMD
jgi:hypothetical protein